MMTRTQITVDREVLRQARARATEMGISLAEYVRRLVARDLGEPEQKGNPAVVFALGHSGGSDIARHKDRMLGEAFAQKRSRRRAR